jgi:hypothetical protein
MLGLLTNTDAETFKSLLALNGMDRDVIRRNCSEPSELPDEGVEYFLSDDGASGFGVTIAGELVGLHSVVRGRGDELVEAAINRGAMRLDCFDGPLVDLYGRHGFAVTDVVPNWTPGEPDVVYMRRFV